MNSVEFDLREYEAREDRLDAEGAALDARAEEVYSHWMKNLDSDLIDGAFAQLTRDEYASLEEDLGSGPMRDVAHAGCILNDALQRYVMARAIKEVS